LEVVTNTRAILIALSMLVPRAGSAADGYVVRGRVVGSDGRPMRQAFVRPYGGPNHLLFPSSDGAFSIAFPRAGGYWIWFGGVHHRNLLMPVVVDGPRPLDLEIRLAGVQTATPLDSVRVTGDFNGFASQGTVPMRMRADGTFVARIDCKRDTLHYQLLGVQAGGAPLCGTQADAFSFDWKHRMLIGNQGGKFVSEVAVAASPVQIVFDPRRLPRSNTPPVVRFVPRAGKAADAYALYREAEKRGRAFDAAARAFQATGGDMQAFHYDFAPARRGLAARIAAERQPLRKHLLLMQYFNLAGADSDSVLARVALKEIPADSPAWSLEWGGPNNVFTTIARAARRPAAVNEYLDRAVATHPDSMVRAALLFVAVQRAYAAKDTDRFVANYVQLVQSQEYAGTTWADRALKRYGPDRKIQPGAPVPDVAFNGLEDSTIVFRPTDYRGRWLLIDFWATWCAPCVAELPRLHAANETYKDHGLAILSVSFDPKRSDVATFRARKWPMPWQHAFAPQQDFEDAPRAFEVVGIPFAVLVDPAGKIVASGPDLRGAELDKTLARFLGAAPDAPH
jgi:thiol-disulfide isomerase/thioredoxin